MFYVSHTQIHRLSFMITTKAIVNHIKVAGDLDIVSLQFPTNSF
jgi:hypothetical protein